MGSTCWPACRPTRASYLASTPSLPPVGWRCRAGSSATAGHRACRPAIRYDSTARECLPRSAAINGGRHAHQALECFAKRCFKAIADTGGNFTDTQRGVFSLQSTSNLHTPASQVFGRRFANQCSEADSKHYRHGGRPTAGRRERRKHSKPQARAIQQSGHQLVRTRHLAEEALHLVASQDGGQAPGFWSRRASTGLRFWWSTSR